jgi:uncharacterized protein
MALTVLKPNRCLIHCFCMQKKILNLANKSALVLIKIYRAVFSPSVGMLRTLPFYPKPSCIFYPTCSEYAVASFKQYPFFEALKKTINRIRRCHPKNDPQVDMP